MVQSATALMRPTNERSVEEKDALELTARLHTQSLEDHRLAERIENALRATGYGALSKVRVSVSAGVVVLRGRVSSYYLKQIVQATALAAPGAQQICNGVDVVRPKSVRQKA